MTPASFHPPDAQTFEVSPRYLKNLLAPALRTEAVDVRKVLFLGGHCFFLLL